MCGINGIISKQVIANIEERIVAMNKSLAHRGPNADKHFIAKNKVALGHRRLSILDLDKRANQPMQLNNGENIIVFNGEIFNFKELRDQLKDKYSFETQSDTEVLLAAVEFCGIDWLLQHANGMFAFAIYNTKTDKIILARDRFGIKPLFYTICNNTLIFSSEIKGILNSGLVQPEFFEEAIDEYLGNRYTREPYSFFKNIFQVKSSTYICFDRNLEQKEVKYWHLPTMNFENKYDESAIINNTNYEIEKAFRRWFIADVRVGAYLSGGVDSSLTTAILSQYLSKQIDTYTIGFDEEGFNEFEYAQKVADIYHTNHRAILCKKSDYFDEWDRLIYFKDAPLAVPNEIPLAQMSSRLSSDITVVISGEGADELFGGYGRIFRSAFDWQNSENKTSFYDYFSAKYEYVGRDLRNKYLLTQKTLRKYFDTRIIDDFEQHKNEENIFRFFHKYHIQGLLQRVDMTTMQTSVEARPPFLDHQLIEYVYTQIPYDLKLHWNSEECKNQAQILQANKYSETLDCPKYILKKIAERYLPKDIIYRKKMGFPVPLSNWFPNLKEQANDFLTNTTWLNTQYLNELIDEIEHNPRAGQLLWMFLNIQMFYNKYFKKNWKW